MFRRILVANRGEIAVRIIRACRELGIQTVAVYSREDAGSEAVRLADHAVAIGPAPSARSYLYAPAIIEAALMTGCEAVHPGYGFLSEDPDFVEICEQNNLVFIGPSAELMTQLGDKAAARALMTQVGLPLLPGSAAPVSSLAEASELVAEIGFPVIIKAVAGGGGRGMTVVWGQAELASRYAHTRATAQSVFGDNRVYIERYCTHARHVEIQVLADQHGNAVHLGDRDCSVQRRHQKLIEESPAPGLAAEVTAAMAERAVTAARAIGYVGAGTMEFLVDGQDFYFMEMNCRLQVEHPVTEAVSGIDIVAEQIRVAAGMPLSFSQADVALRGTSIECRINAEDPVRDFAPTPGTLERFIAPGGPFVRVDSAAQSGGTISAYYDSLLAKVIVWAPTRSEAISRMDRCLHEMIVEGPGVATTAEVMRRILRCDDFVAARHDTSWLENRAKSLVSP